MPGQSSRMHITCYCDMCRTCRIISKYEHFRSRALKVPDDSREMMDLIAYMQDVKADLVKDQWEAVVASLQSLTYLLDIHSFTPEEMQQNRTTLTWPEKLGPIFEQNEEIIEASKVYSHNNLRQHVRDMHACM